jgi:microcystin-dependent protein
MQLVNVSSLVGSVINFMGKVVFDQNTQTYNIDAWGWTVCDGRKLEKAKYPELYFMIGDIYGSDDTTFNLPDLRGYFLRGVSKEEDKASTENRKAASDKGEVNGVGSTQEFALQTHVHTYDKPNNPMPPSGDKGAPCVSAITPNTETSAPIESKLSPPPAPLNVSEYETRPSNVFVYFIIKYTSYLPSFHLNNHFKI